MTTVITDQPQDRVDQFYYALKGDRPSPFEARQYLYEEMDELREAIDNGAPPDLTLKEMADVMFTLYGYALAQWWNLDDAFRAVCDSNMTKERTPVGKIAKGANYQPPDLREFV